MEHRLRIYRLRPGSLAAFADEWRREVLPLRRRLGFEVLGAWTAEEDETFVWLLAHPHDYDAANRAYYESPERRALDPDPARHILEPRDLRVRPLPLDP